MGEVVKFQPKVDAQFANNLLNFVRFCRNELTAFGKDLPFDAATWDVWEHYDIRGRGNTREYLSFTEFAHAGEAKARAKLSDAPDGHMPMPEPLASFAKAYVRFEQARAPKKSLPQSDIAAFRVLSSVLRARGLEPDPGLIDASVLEHCRQAALDRYTRAVANAVCNRLARISDLLAVKLQSPLAHHRWRHGIVASGYTNRTGPAAEARRQARLPSAGVLEAIPKAFRRAQEPRDVIITSLLAILCAAPDRLNEVLVMPVDCEVEAELGGSTAYGLRWAGSKGFADHVKWIAPPMVDTVKEALRRIRKHTEGARRIALWYEGNSDSLYLDESCEHLRSRELISRAEVNRIIGSREGVRNHERFAFLKLEPHSRGRRKDRRGHGFLYRFVDVERAILGLLPRRFPIMDRRTGLKYSEALLVVPLRMFQSNRRKAYHCVITEVTASNLAAAIGGRQNEPSLFLRLGLCTPEEPLKASSHQFRHWLNTLAHKGGLSDIDIATWSGRSDVRQNAAYDHETGEEILARKRRAEAATLDHIRSSMGDPEVARGAIAVRPRHMPVSREQFAAMLVPTAHATELGFCIHDFATAPCPLLLACMKCVSQVCIKGHTPGQLDRVAHVLGVARQSLGKAQAALEQDFEGAGEWIRAHTETVARLAELHAILADPDVPAGAVIQLSRSCGTLTWAEQAMEDRASQAVGLSGGPPQLPGGAGEVGHV